MADTKNTMLDINDRQKSFQTIADRIGLLNEGFRALCADYSHHIEITFGKEHDILKLKKNIDFRLYSSQFHLELLLRQHFVIEDRIKKLYETNPASVLNPVYPSHPLLDHCEKEITSIFDSVVFHLASVYDYLSSIVNFICNNKDKSITKWSQLVKSCRDSKNTYSTKEIAKIILNQNSEFVDKLYRYRSRVIHETADINPISLSIKVASGKTDVKFSISHVLIKNFSSLKEKSQGNKISVSFASEWLIHSTISSLADILFALKSEMESVSTFPKHIKDTDFIILYNDPETGFAEPVSKPMWKNVHDNIYKF